MTKRILFIISGLLILGAIIAIIITNKEKVSDKIITIQTENNYLYTESKRINFRIYTNKKKHKIHFANNFSHVFLESEDEGQRFELELVDITYSHQEKYINDEYYCYIYSFIMPRLESNLLINEANLNITLINNINYILPIGNFNFMYFSDVGVESVISVDGLFGYKRERSEYSRLAKIIIEYEKKMDFTLEDVNINGKQSLEFKVTNEEIEILIPYQQLALNQAPVILIFSAGGKSITQVIDNYHFFSDYQVLENSGDLVNVMAADWT